jgi:NAD(P)-dependent dehydrogenase (short-subunit alcohol dehydrogenase family)
VVTDVSDPQQVQALANTAVATYGRIDTWVGAGAVVLYAPFAAHAPAEWRQVIDVDLNGQAYDALAPLPYVQREGRGALIFVSSALGRRALPLVSSYSAAKHGVNALAEALSLELRKQGSSISVTTVMPASINTPLFSHARTKLGVKPKPADPVYQPRVVADVIVYAAEHPTREIYAGGAAPAILAPQGVSRRLMDALVLRLGFATQQTNEPKSADAPHNLWTPTDEVGRKEA